MKGIRKAERNRGHLYTERGVYKENASDTGPVAVEAAWRRRGNISSKNSSEEKIFSAENKATLVPMLSLARP
jgi:hypothetical protein